MEVGGGRAVGTHRAARGHAAGVPGDHLRCLVRGRLGQTPRAAYVRLQVERLGIVRGAPRQTRHARRVVGSPHPPPPPVVPHVKHILKRGIQHPIVAFPVPSVIPGHLDEALVERQIVPYTVLPPFLVLFEEGELGDDVVIYPAERLPLVGAVLDGHGDESHVGVRWLPLLAAGLLTFGFRPGRVGADVQKLHSLVGVGLLLCIHGSGVREDTLKAVCAAEGELLSSWYNAGGGAAPITTPEPPPRVPPNCPPCAGARLTAWTTDPSIWRPDQEASSPVCSTAGALLEWPVELHAATRWLHSLCSFLIGGKALLLVSSCQTSESRAFGAEWNLVYDAQESYKIVPHESPCLFILLFFSLRVAKEKGACLAGGVCGRLGKNGEDLQRGVQCYQGDPVALPNAAVLAVERRWTSCVQMLSMRPQPEEHPVRRPQPYGLKRRTPLELLPSPRGQKPIVPALPSMPLNGAEQRCTVLSSDPGAATQEQRPRSSDPGAETQEKTGVEAEEQNTEDYQAVLCHLCCPLLCSRKGGSTSASSQSRSMCCEWAETSMTEHRLTRGVEAGERCLRPGGGCMAAERPRTSDLRGSRPLEYCTQTHQHTSASPPVSEYRVTANNGLKARV
ncbi:hypothetical protein EYF80_002002 [Liparis tanakae]|uniref:Uncharacterized protein n=1 Tax=Liparis tanakae TaxID=230148 RepID=A0A4Z2JBE7_9TELE|nr:hypothetical protein EYF80_002002 [Liparis tanakae]